MTKYISKAAVVAEIEKLKKEIESQDYAAYTEAYIIGAKHTLETVSDILNTLEVKEVDLGKEIEKVLKQHHMLAVGKKDFASIARHFFELGLKAQKGEEV